MTFFIDTLGCKVNQYETQAMQTLLEQDGHKLTTTPGSADCRIINTCAVTGESGRKSRQAVRRAQKESPNAIIAVCGCFSQISPEDVANLGADLVSGSGDRKVFIENIEKLFISRSKIVNVDNALKRHDFEVLPSGGMAGRTRAMLKIQDGCSNFCSYCVIPYSRGPVRSMSLDDITAESSKIAAAGYKEIVITGIEISSYGKDFKDGTGLIDAIYAISKSAPGVRLHLGSLEPRTATEEFCKKLSEIPNVCDHFHMSLQSGCDRTLKRMNRKYDTAKYTECIENLRRFFPDCGITTDVIVGFPGETEEDFNDCVEYLKKCRFSDVHVFPYSPRPGTPAAAMPEQLTNDEKHQRAVIAGTVTAELAESFASQHVGKNLSVLFETEKDGISHGHSGNYLKVSVEGTNLHNIVNLVHVTAAKGQELCGKIIK